MDQCDLVAHLVEGKKFYEVSIKGIVPAGGAAIAANVRRDRIVAGGGQGRHHLAPAITKVRKTVQQEHERPARRARLDHVHRQAIDVGHQAHPNTGRKRVAAIGTRFGVDRLAGDLCFRRRSGSQRHGAQNRRPRKQTAAREIVRLTIVGKGQ